MSISVPTQRNTTQSLKEENHSICNNMDEPGEHYAKWNKPVIEGQILEEIPLNKVSKIVKLIPAE